MNLFVSTWLRIFVRRDTSALPLKIVVCLQRGMTVGKVVVGTRIRIPLRRLTRHDIPLVKSTGNLRRRQSLLGATQLALNRDGQDRRQGANAPGEPCRNCLSPYVQCSAVRSCTAVQRAPLEPRAVYNSA